MRFSILLVSFSLALMLISPKYSEGQITPAQPLSRWQGEAAPIFRAQEVLAAEFLQGPNYTIAQDVPVRDYKYLFTLRTEYGSVPAWGRAMLELRLREMHALDRARRWVDEPQMFKGMMETVKQTPQGVAVTLKDPLGAVMRTPRGIQRMAANALNTQNQRAGSEIRRKMAFDLGVDPETSNPLLAEFLDNIAARKGLGKGISNVGLNFMLPGVGLLSKTKDFKVQLVDKAPHEINAEMQRELIGMGVWEPVARRFCHSPSLTTIQRLHFVDRLRTLGDVEGRLTLVHRASTAQNEAEGLSMLQELQMIQSLHQHHRVATVDTWGLPLVVLADGRVVIVSAADYLHDTQEVRDAISAYRAARPNDPTVFATAGRVSQNAQAMILSNGIDIVQDGRIELITNIAKLPGAAK